MGSGNIDVGNKTPTPKSGRPIGERLGEGLSEPEIDRSNVPEPERPKICGAMSLQRGDSGRGNESVPQKFVQLVGCRDPKVRPEPWVHPHPIPAKR